MTFESANNESKHHEYGTQPPPILEVASVNKSFAQPGAGPLQVLTDIRFRIDRGRTTAIVGHSGSGKTTLLSLIAGLDRPDSGNIILAGNDLNEMDQDRLARYRAAKIGIIFQQFHLMPHLTAGENISLPLEIRKAQQIEERTHAMLRKVGLWDRRNHLPGQLSGGECQRVAIARALVVTPDLILADEPTGNLDTETGQIVARLLFDLVEQEEKSMVLVTHNPELAARCHQVRHLEKGRLV
ncbi:MAG TPA: ABC transporter ATP-binding protein [Desulfobacteraceae bacterium]|nr:ABC transporter ATP-binding protein [Desulfobacteraceae bacterium]